MCKDRGNLESGVRTLLDRLARAWERGDGRAYGALFYEDAQYIEAPGVRVRGRDMIAARHQRIFDSLFRGTRIASNTPAVIRPIAEDIVLVESSGAVVFPGEDASRVEPNGLMTLVVKREADEWRIVSFQNTPTGRFRSMRFICRYFLSRLRTALGLNTGVAVT
jgi:uncharacterized protein (TIGR02246 family)